MTRLEFSPTKDRQSASAAARGTVNKLALYVTTHRRTRLTKRRSFSLNMPLRSKYLFRSVKYKRRVSSKFTNDGTTQMCCKLQISQICVETPPLKKKGPLLFLYKLYIFQRIPKSLLRGDAHSRHHTDINRAQPSDVLNTKRSSLSLVIPSLSLCPMWLLKASAEAAVVTCQAASRTCLQDLLPERRQWQGPDWWCGKQMSGESASFSCSGCGGWRDGSREINLEGGLGSWIYIYTREVLITSVSEGFCCDGGFILI